MDAGRFKIRCPSCQAEGRARLEMLDRRVRCKHCSHTFRALPIDGAPTPEPSSPRGLTTPPAKVEKPSRESLRPRVEALEREVRKIRRSLPGPVPRYPEAEPAGSEVADLRAQLDQAQGAAREAESRQVAQKVADADQIEALRREVADLRAQLDRTGSPAPATPSTFEPSAESPMANNARSWP